MVRKLKEGDVLFIKSIDRLGRNYEEIIEQWQFLSKTKNVDIVVLDFPLLDTRKHEHGLTGKFLSDMVLQILSYVAQVERENTKQRQMEGIKEAKKKGVSFGRPKNEIPDAFYNVYPLWKNKEITQREASRRLYTNHNAFIRWVRRYEQMI
jgi:DNA invertase Pin-like site-specific DNA recombinase